ncbi:MAG TPA: hypothetical protein VIU15_38595 [Streptomyces sp.]
MSEPDREHGAEALSDAALQLYASLAEAEQEIPESQRAALQELLSYGLARPGYFLPNTWVAVPPWDAEADLLAAEQARMASSLARLREVPRAMVKAAQAYAASGLHISGRSYIIESREKVNSEIDAALNNAQSEITTAQPGSRSRTAMSVATPRDRELLRRGISLRTLYHPSSRTNAFVQEYVEAVTELGGEVRTLGLQFPRMILVDNSAAFITLELPGAPEHAALHTTDPAHIAWMRNAVFDAFWPLGEVWDPAAQAPAAAADEIKATVLKLLLDGHTQRAIEPKVGLSRSGLDRVISDIKADYGAKSLFQLGARYRESELCRPEPDE